MCFLPQFLQCFVPSDEHGAEGATTLAGVAGTIHVGFRMPDATHGAEETIALVGAAWWWQGPFWTALSDLPNGGVFKTSEEAPDGKKKRDTLSGDSQHYCFDWHTRFGQGRGIQC